MFSSGLLDVESHNDLIYFTAGSISLNQFLNYISVPVISNAECLATFPRTLQPSNICTSGIGTKGACHGDSGGPLAVYRNNRWILVSI